MKAVSLGGEWGGGHGGERWDLPIGQSDSGSVGWKKNGPIGRAHSQQEKREKGYYGIAQSQREGALWRMRQGISG
jgi:hypothetical protein